MTSRSRLVLASISVVAVLSSVFVLYRTRPAVGISAAAERESRRRQLVEQGSATYATLASVAVDELATPGDVRALLSRAYVQSPPPPEAGSVDELLDHVAEFVFHLYRSETPEEYRAWRAASGYELCPLDDLVGVFGVDGTYTAVFGEPIPEAAESAEIFDAFWANDAASSARAGTVTRIVVDHRGLIICGGIRSRADPSPTPFRGDPADGGLSEEEWNGMEGGGVAPWYGSRGLGPRRLLLEESSVAYCDVGVIVEHRSGARLPVRIGCLWNPHTRQWSVENLVYLNHPKSQDTFSTKVF